MSAIEPKPLTDDDRAYYREAIERRIDWVDENRLWAHVQWLEQREAHVIEVLRQAESGCEYGFVRDLLAYLGEGKP